MRWSYRHASVVAELRRASCLRPETLADRLFERLDVLVAPGRLTVATPLGQEFRGGMRGTARDIMGAVGNGAGLPALIVPNGFGERGLPTSLQLMGRAWEENTVLAAGRAIQARTDWHTKHPPVEP